MKKIYKNHKITRANKRKMLSMCRLYQKYPIDVPAYFKKIIYRMFDEFANEAKLRAEKNNTQFRYCISRNEIDYAIYVFFFEILNKLRNNENINVPNIGKFSYKTKMIPKITIKRKHKTIKIIEEKIPKFRFNIIKKHINKRLNGDKIKQWGINKTKYVQNYKKNNNKASIFREYLGFNI